MYNIEKALDVLISHKIISDKQYWINNHIKLKHTDELIVKIADYIEPYKEVEQEIKEIKKVYYTETPNGTRQIFLPPEKLHIDIFDKLTKNNSFTKYKYAVNGVFFGGTTFATSILMRNGDYMGKCRWTSNYGKPQSCLIINKDNTVWMTKLNNITDLGNKLYSAKHIIGGIGLLNETDPDFKYNPSSEGFTGSILAGLERACNKTAIGYIAKTNQIVLLTRPNIHHTNGYSLFQLAKDCELTYCVSLDGSGSTFCIADGKYMLKGDNRGIYTALYAE